MGRHRREHPWADRLRAIMDGEWCRHRAGTPWDEWEDVVLRADGAPWPVPVLAAYLERETSEIPALSGAQALDRSTAAGEHHRTVGGRQGTVYRLEVDRDVDPPVQRLVRLHDRKSMTVHRMPGLLNYDPLAGWRERYGQPSIREWLEWPADGPSLHDVERALGRPAWRAVDRAACIDRGAGTEAVIVPPREVWRVMRKLARCQERTTKRTPDEQRVYERDRKRRQRDRGTAV